MRRGIPIGALAALVGVFVSCGSEPTGPDEPLPSGAVVPVSDTVTGLLRARDTISYRLRPDTDVEVAVFFQAMSGGLLRLVVLDSAGTRLGEVSSPIDTNRAHLTWRRTARLALQARRTYSLRIASPAGLPSTFRLLAYRVNRAPEHVPATPASAAIIEAEDLENSADIDEFLFTAQANDRVVAYIQSIDSLSVGQVTLTVANEGRDRTFGWVMNGRASEPLEAHATGALLPQGGRYRWIVEPEWALWTEPPFVAGRYRLQMRVVDQAPESVPVRIASGDTVTGERIDYVGDIDTFVVAGASGQEANLFFQALGDAESALLARVPGIAGPSGYGVTAFSPPNEPVLLRRASGAFTVPEAGRFTVVVAAENAYALSRGGYRLFPYLINAAPEHVSAVLQPTDTVTGEAIEAPGDIDEYVIDVPQPGPYNFLIWRSGSQPSGSRFTLSVRGSNGDIPVWPNLLEQARGDELGVVTGRMQLPAGSVRLRVTSAESFGTAYYGPYRLQVYALDDAPEGRSPAIAVGQTIAEVASPLGDVDIYTFDGHEGQLLDVVAVAGEDASNSNMEFTVRSLDGTSLSYYAWVGPASMSRDLRRIGRFALPAAGTYRIAVGAVGNAGRYLSEEGSYRITLSAADTVPEAAPVALPIGQTLTTEPINRRGDIDEFRVSGTPGSRVQAVLVSRAGSGERLRVDVLEPGSRTPVQSVESYGYPGETGPAVIPPSGMLRVRVYEPRGGFQGGNAATDFGTIGAYDLLVRSVDN